MTWLSWTSEWSMVYLPLCLYRCTCIPHQGNFSISSPPCSPQWADLPWCPFPSLFIPNYPWKSDLVRNFNDKISSIFSLSVGYEVKTQELFLKIEVPSAPFFLFRSFSWWRTPLEKWTSHLCGLPDWKQGKVIPAEQRTILSGSTASICMCIHQRPPESPWAVVTTSWV